MAYSSRIASFSCFPANSCPPAFASLASSSSVFIGSGRRTLSPPANLVLVARHRRPGGSRSSRGLDCRCLFGLGVPELVVIAGVAALVFGPKKLPEVGRSIGKTVKSFQQISSSMKAAKEFESELKKEPEEGSQPPLENPKSSIENLIAAENEDYKKEVEASGTKDST